jgi:hypothetical protein
MKATISAKATLEVDVTEEFLDEFSIEADLDDLEGTKSAIQAHFAENTSDLEQLISNEDISVSDVQVSIAAKTESTEREKTD